MPGTVSDVSATFVANTMRRPLDGVNTRRCSPMDSRAYSGTISAPEPSRCAKAFAVSRISRSVGKDQDVAAGPAHSSETAASIAAVCSVPVSGGRYRNSTGRSDRTPR